VRAPLVRLTSALALAISLACVSATVARAQEGGGGTVTQAEPAPPEPHAVGAYTGVTPGTANPPPRRPTKARPTLVTWPGFQQRPDGASRLFVQTNVRVETEQRQEGTSVVVLLKNTRISLRNNRRPLETRFFNTPVTRARVERRGRDTALVLEMRSNVAPMISTDTGADGLFFVYVEFPNGEYLPEELRRPELPEGVVMAGQAPPPQAPPPSTVQQQTQYNYDARIENERPPGM
jgi:hypothetical protein